MCYHIAIMRETIPVLPSSSAPPEFGETRAKLDRIRSILREEYESPNGLPWIVAYSGGKDSTLLLQLVFEVMLGLSPAKRERRHVHIIANDTLVESPLVIGHLKNSMATIRKAVSELNLPVTAAITQPCIDQTFWVNVIGRGYIPPTRSFRWCTDRMKIAPANNLIRNFARANNGAILLIGTRKSESSARRNRMVLREESNGRMNPHDSIQGCLMFPPLADLTDDEVWAILMQSRPPWGGTHRNLITLYRNARGGECPTVLSKIDAPSCGTTSPRFGCWTCTVVAKDRSLEGLVDSGFDELEPLLEFREWLVELREKDGTRMKERRDGTSKYRADGSRVYGPFKLEIRSEILHRLLQLEKQLGVSLISTDEVEIIKDIWQTDGYHVQARSQLVQKARAFVTAEAA